MNLKSLFEFGNSKKEEKSDDSVNDLNKDGIIGEYYENDYPIIVKFVNRIPNETTRAQLPMLTIISWKYDGSQRNGMPTNEVNQKMIKLEEAIENSKISNEIFEHAYSRTGNSFKELVYYSKSQEKFMQNLNKALSNHERYPIDIDFYEDGEWNELQKLITDFKLNEKDKKPKA